MAITHFRIGGHIYYITTNVYKRLPIFTSPTFVLPIYDSLNYYRYKQSYKLLGYVIMPDHLHLLIWLYGKASVAEIMRDFKTYTAKRIIRQAEVEDKAEWLYHFANAGKETGRSDNKVWQDHYWDVNVYTEQFLRQKLNYIHRNPLRADLVKNAEDYRYSSYRNYVFDEEWFIEIDRGWS
jgi:putative transposase